MANLQIQNLPDSIYNQIQSLAKQQNRTLDEEVISLLAQALTTLTQEPPPAASPSITEILQTSVHQRQNLPDLQSWLDSTALIREDRER